jgi:hypothetical protein
MEETERSDRVPEPDFARGRDKEDERDRKARPDFARGGHEEGEGLPRDKYDTDFARGLDDEAKKAAAKRHPDYARGLHREKEQGEHNEKE